MRSKTVSFTTPNQTYVYYTMNIPSCIDPTYWKDHNLTEVDIRHIVTYIPSWLMWITAVMYDKIVTWAMVKYSFSDIFGIMVNNKVLAMQHLIQHIHALGTYNRIDTLSYTLYKHTPPLPKYSIDIATFDFLVTKIVPNLQPAVFQQEHTIIPYCKDFKGKLWVPTICEGHIYICMVAIYDEHHNTTSFGTGYSHMPKVGRYQGRIVTLSDEVIWFCK